MKKHLCLDLTRCDHKCFFYEVYMGARCTHADAPNEYFTMHDSIATSQRGFPDWCPLENVNEEDSNSSNSDGDSSKLSSKTKRQTDRSNEG